MEQQHSSTHNLELETIEITVKSVPHMEEDTVARDGAKAEEKKTDNLTNVTVVHKTQGQNKQADKSTNRLHQPATDQPPRQSQTNANTAKAQKVDDGENNTTKKKQEQNKLDPTVIVGRSTIYLLQPCPCRGHLLKDMTDDEEDTNHDKEEPKHNCNNGV